MHKAGFVNIVGNPNVGKSTLMNQLVGERISIATFKAQTTRHRIMGIVNTPDAQIVFSDTPGVLKPNYKLQESMLAFSESALQDADVLLYVTDVVENPEKNMTFLEKVKKMPVPVLLLINKIDQSDQLIGTASDKIGTRYRAGGTTTKGFDCSGLMCNTFGAYNITLPRSSIEQSQYGVKIKTEEARKGDLIFFKTNGKRHINHVGMVVEVNEEEIKFIHSTNHKGVIISSTKETYYDKNLVQVNRVIK